MADKIRRTYPVSITISEGERPTAAKLTAIATQARNGLGIVESALGDLWTQSGDGILAGTDSDFRKHLQIANVGRIIGIANDISYGIDHSGSTIRFVDVPIGYGKETGKANTLSLNVYAGTTRTPGDSGVTFEGSSVGNILSVVATGDWYYDPIYQKVYSYDIMSDLTFTSDIISSAWPGSTIMGPNVIPHREQDTSFKGLKIIAHPSISGRYYIYLPPRLRCDVGISTYDREVYLGSFDIAQTADNAGTSTTNYSYFWSDTANAPSVSHPHYRYILPTVLGYSGLTAGSRLPDGFIRLFNRSTGSVIDNITFYKPSASPYSTYTFCVEMVVGGDTTNIDAVVSASGTDVVADYANDFCLITAGTSIAERLNNLEKILLSHNHLPIQGDNATPRIDHMGLSNMDPSSDAAHMPSNVILTGSAWESDGHLQYVNRLGSVAHGSYPTNARDIYNGAILGDVILGSTSKGGSAPYFNNITGDSVKLFFGMADTTSAPYFFYEFATGTIYFKNTTLDVSDGSVTGRLSSGVYGAVLGFNTSTDGGGYGVYGFAQKGRGVIAAGDPSSPDYAAFRIIPQDDEPTNASEGDIYVNSATRKLLVYIDGAWREAAKA
jgi:hypothetical protein